MKITLSRLGKKFNRTWLFRNMELELQQKTACAILGINGSGKSTLLQLIAGNISPTEGSVSWTEQSKNIPAEEIYSRISIAAPYLELPEELTLDEVLKFHFSFKQLHRKAAGTDLTGMMNLESSRSKQIRLFSSGMKQRLKLCLAMCSDTPMLLLDEPCTNLDSQGVEWYHEMTGMFCTERITLVASNQEQEYSFCNEKIKLSEFIPSKGIQ